MANLIPEELNALIQQYLTDGVLTDKERQVILNKAEKMGLDRDEIDLYLDAEVQKIDQQTDAAVRKQKGKQCPYCGGSVPLLTDKCPHCGENITAEASQELQEIFDNLEEALVNLKSGKDIHASKATVERFSRKAKMYYGSNPRVKKLLEEITNETIAAEKRAKTLVRNRGILNFVKEHTKMTLFIGLIALLALFWGIRKIVTSFDETQNASACIQAMKKTIKKGDIDNAIILYKKFDGSGQKDVVAGIEPQIVDYIKDLASNDNLEKAEQDIEKIYDAFSFHMSSQTEETISSVIAEAYWKKGDPEKALEVDGKHNGASYSHATAIRKAIQNDYLEKGEYTKAVNAISWECSIGEMEDLYKFVCHCIDHMRDNGEEAKLSSFVNQILPVFESHPSEIFNSPRPEFEAEYKKYQQRVMEYANQ